MRIVLALAAIVAVVGISLGIIDYVVKKSNPPASTDSAAVDRSNNSDTAAAQKKDTTAKARQGRVSATQGKTPAQQASADEKPLISEDFADNVGAQAAQDEVEAGMDRNNRVRNIVRPALPSKQCLPLPNGTKAGDVDAFYYKDWAKEYSCLIP